jgi:hypothetical protein
MNDRAIREILISSELSEIEVAITDECNTYVNKEFIDISIGFIRREIDNSCLPISYIREQLKLKREKIIKLGIQILKYTREETLEEEYPGEEEPSEIEKTKIVSSNGIGIGFGIKYAIYLDFLESNPKELLTFIRKERIPNAAKFAQALAKLYST